MSFDRECFFIGCAALVGACGLSGSEVDDLSAALDSPVSLVPTSDVSLRSIWGGGGGAPIFRLVDDGMSFAASDFGSSFARSAPGAASAALTVGYSGAPAGGAAQVVVHTQAWAINGGAGTLQIRLYDGATIVGTGPVHALGTTPSNLSDSFTGLAITDANQLRTELIFANSSGTGSLIDSLVWIEVTPPPPASTGGLRGEYFDDLGFTVPALTRVDPTVDFDWGSGSPAPQIAADTFSVRWTGSVTSSLSEPHTFYLRSDDGARLWVNGQLLIDNWTDHAPVENAGSISLAAGQSVPIRIEFYERGGGAVAQLSWSSTTRPKAIVPQTALSPDATTPPDPPVSELLVPREGAWWGAYARASAAVGWDWNRALHDFEGLAGRKLDIVYRYHDWNSSDNGMFPDVWERAQMAEGYIVNVAWESRLYRAGTNITWAEIANGSQDAVIDAAAQRSRAAQVKFMITFDHEMDNAAAHATDGPDADFVAAYRRIVDRFRAAGVTNVIWVWTPMGWSGTWPRYPGLYPGDAYVDWLGYDPYNFYDCNRGGWKDPYTTIHGYYEWMHAAQQMTWHGAKPYMLNEYSSHEDANDLARKGAWYAAFVDALKQHPDIKAVQVFNSTVTLSGGFCNLVVDSSPAAVAGFRAAGSDPYVNQPHE